MNKTTAEIVTALENRSFIVFADENGHIIASKREAMLEVERVDDINRYTANREIFKNLEDALGVGNALL